MLLNPFTFHSPKTLSEAVNLYSKLEEVKILAGGTFLITNLKLLKKKGVKTPKNIISLRKVSELKGIHEEKDVVHIKSMTTISEILESPVLTNNLNILKVVGRNIATNSIRNMGTIGGNLTCRYPWTELGTALIALEAKLHFVGHSGRKEEIISADEFFKHAAKTYKILTHVSVQKDKASVLSYQRVKKSGDIDIPLLSLCIKANMKKDHLANTRAVINNGFAFAQRDAVLEDYLNHAAVNPSTTQEAINHLDTAIYDMRSDDYKKHIFRISIKNAIEQLIENKRQSI